MPEVQHVSSTGARKKGRFALPPSFDGTVHEGAMYHAVRAFLANRRQGTHATKTRSEVSGGNQKPWRQKGTGRARQGTTRAAQWRGGGIVFGPHPRRYHVTLPRKVRQRARQSALNARVRDGQFLVIESLAFDSPRTRQVVDLLATLDLTGRRVLMLTAGHHRAAYLSARNLSNVHVMPYRDVTAYEVLWSESVIVEEGALAADREGGATDG